MTESVAGVPVESLTNWGEPFLRGGRLLRIGPPTKLFGLVFSKAPRALRDAGIYVWRESGRSMVVQYLTEAPVPVAAPQPVSVTVNDAMIRVNEHGLKAWQPAVVRRLKFFWGRGQRALADLSDTGVGKTYVFLALCRELNRRAVVITVKNAIEQWKAAADLMQVPAVVTNYEALKTGRHPWVQWRELHDAGGASLGDWPHWQLNSQTDLLGFDEAQRCKSPDHTLNSKLLLWAAYQKVPLCLLSATVMSSPVHLRAAGYALGLHANHDFGAWLEAHGCFRAGQDWYFNNDRGVLRDIHGELFNSCAVRVKKSDLGDQFPPTVIEPWLMEFPATVGKAYRELAARLDAFRERAKNFGAGAFAETQKARMNVEFLKVPATVEMAQDWAEEGMKVCQFYNFNEPADEAAKLLGCPKITGETKPKDRMEAIRAFQADELPHLVLNSEAGGTAINLHGAAERGTLIMPTWKPDTLRQVLGRTHRAGGGRSIQRILCAAGTVETDICSALRRKLDNLDTLNDGDTQGNLQWVNAPLRTKQHDPKRIP